MPGAEAETEVVAGETIVLLLKTLLEAEELTEVVAGETTVLLLRTLLEEAAAVSVTVMM